MNLLKKITAPLLKLLVAGAIVAFLIRNNSEGLASTFRSIHPVWLSAAFALYALHIFANAWRWHLLLKVQKIECSLRDAVSLTMQSCLFSRVFTGGSIGGVLVRKGFITAKLPKEQKFDGAFTILMDRFTGMIGIFLVALLMLPFCLRYMDMESRVTAALIWLLVAGSVCGLLASVVVFQHRKLERIRLYRRMKELADRFSHGMFSKVADAIDSYKEYKKEIFICIVASMVFVNLVLGLAGFLVAHGVDPEWTSAGVSMEAITLGNIAGLLPLTPSGLGARDFFIKTILQSAGMNGGTALATALCFTMIIIAFNLIGGLFFVFDGRKKELALASAGEGELTEKS